MIQACNLRVCNCSVNAIQVDAPNVKFFGENVSPENWIAGEAFCSGPPSSFAYLGIGFNCSPGDTQVACHPAPQFHVAS